MGFTRQQWALDFLHALGNDNPAPSTVNFVLGWTHAETGDGQGSRFNLLNTTQWAPFATNYNDVGVKNYVSYQQGINANVQTIRNGLYGDLLNALVTNDANALGAYSGTPSQGVLQNLSTWCACGYGRGFVQSGGQRANDVFSYANAVPIKVGGTVNPLQQALQTAPKVVEQKAVNTAIGPASGIVQNVPFVSQLSGLLDPIRWLKGIIGGVLLIAGFVLVFAVLSERAANSQTFQTLAKTAGKVGLAAA